MRLTLPLLLLSLAFVCCDDDGDSIWEELKRKAPLAFQMLKDKVSDAVEEWRDKEDDYTRKEKTDEMLCEIDEDDDKVHKILKKLEKKDDKFKKLVKKIKNFFKARKDALDCSKHDSEGDECLCKDDSNDAFCFLESVKDSYERLKGKLSCVSASLPSSLIFSLLSLVIIVLQ